MTGINRHGSFPDGCDCQEKSAASVGKPPIREDFPDGPVPSEIVFNFSRHLLNCQRNFKLSLSVPEPSGIDSTFLSVAQQLGMK
jgi:hypothetical protein